MLKIEHLVAKPASIQPRSGLRRFGESSFMFSIQSLAAANAAAKANRSFARMKLARPALALEDAQEAVRLDSKNTKAAFRKGRCELLLGLYDSAAATSQSIPTPLSGWDH